jgi:putative phosphoribosyl transferase
MAPAPDVVERAVIVPAGRSALEGVLAVPAGARGIVAFAHGTGSGLRSPRNLQVAEALHVRGFATLLLDLLTAADVAQLGGVRFDVELLTRRLDLAVAWLAEAPATAELPLGLFGSSTGAAAALQAAAVAPERVAAVVARGGRPDLAAGALERVRAPTLLIVGGRDGQVLDLNRAAKSQIAGTCEVAVVPGAGHLFEEPGALDEVARLAGDWFARHLPSSRG